MCYIKNTLRFANYKVFIYDFYSSSECYARSTLVDNPHHLFSKYEIMYLYLLAKKSIYIYYVTIYKKKNITRID